MNLDYHMCCCLGPECHSSILNGIISVCDVYLIRWPGPVFLNLNLILYMLVVCLFLVCWKNKCGDAKMAAF